MSREDYQSFRCPRCGHRDSTDTSVAECSFCGWTSEPTAECDGCEQEHPAEDLVDFSGKRYCGTCLAVIQEEAAEAAEEAAEPEEVVARY